MKKEERLHRIFGDIDDDLVAEAAHRPVALKVWLPRVTAAAAAVALVAGVLLAQPWEREPLSVSDGTVTTTTATTQPDKSEADTTTQKQTAQTEIGIAPPVSTAPDKPTDTTTFKPTYTTMVGTPTTTAPTGEDAWYEPHWEDKPIWQRFPEFERFGQSHTVRDITIGKAMVEEHLENVFLRGYDIYTDTEYEIEGQIYHIKGIHPDCAVALQYPDRTDFFPAINRGYTPTTLGEFITDLNLREHLRVGTVYHSYRDADGTYHDKEYAGLTVEKVWEMLLSDESLPNVHDDKNWQFQFDTKLSIRIDMPLLGYENISISLSENGYLRTSLLDTEKLFCIGEDTVDAFMDYVEEHCRLQKDDQLTPMPGETNPGTTLTSAAQPPKTTQHTVKG